MPGLTFLLRHIKETEMCIDEIVWMESEYLRIS